MAAEESAASVVVVGSANADLVYAVARIPSPGETVLASGQARHAGGKGLNQAVAAARSGGSTAFVGAVGDDDAGQELLATMREAGIDTAGVRVVDAPTGVAIITVQDDGENCIVVASGANATVETLSASERESVARARVLLAQHEVPSSAVAEAATVAQSADTLVVLNAAPVRELPDELLDLVDVLVVNEHEALALAASGDVDAAARELATHVSTVVLTLGARGCDLVRSDGTREHIDAVTAEVVDTTGAGDTFTGVLGAALANGLDVGAAARRAVVAAAISVERAGAVPSIPTSAEIDARTPA